jgi:MFS superfamily sulfate permease-like transporter
VGRPRGRHPENLAPPGVAVLRVESALFFANADVVRREVRARERGDAGLPMAIVRI